MGKWLLGSVVALTGLYLTYIYNGADSLRTEIYQPLYGEVGTLEASLKANTPEQPYSTKTFETLNRSGEINRIPKAIRAKLEDVYQKAGEAFADLTPITHHVEVTVPNHVRQIRNENNDSVWTQKAVEQLNRELDLRGLGGVYARFQFHHIGHSITIDRRDPTHLRVVQPAAVTMGINDWISFPQLAGLEQDWTDLTYLQLHPKAESWMYRITREDLTRNKTDLRSFLQPIYVELAGDGDFQQLVSTENQIWGPLTDLKKRLEERIAHPKQLRDVFE